MLKNKFVVLSHGRTGSALFCNLLSQHHNVKSYHELYHDVQDERDTVNGEIYRDGENAAEFLEQVIFKDPNESGKVVIGFKLFFFHARKDANAFSLWEKLLSDKDIKIVFLFRRNLFDAFVSNYRASEANVWQLSDKHDSKHIDKKLSDYNRRVKVPIWKCRNYMEGLVAGRSWLLEKFSTHQNICLYYEDLIANMQVSMQEIFQFLGVVPINVRAGNKKLNRIPHEEGITNFHEIKSYFEYSIYRDFFCGD